ncbi:MAG: CoA transferase [Chloroflexota bacterium]
MPQVFEGLKVADFTWAAVGPIMSRYLANYGATVVRVESATRPDVVRIAPPFKGGQTHVDRSAYYSIFNPGKHSLTINMAQPKGREVAHRLVLWSDVVMESFAPRVMKNWGLDYESLRREKPDLIMISTTNLGMTGPHAARAGFGTQLVSLAGFTHLTGWPDGDPNQPYGAYTDLVAPRFGAAAIIAALDHRRRTGQGQYIDLSQLEASAHFLAPVMMDYFASGREAFRSGNRDPQATPHGAFPCQGDDRWLAIACTTQQEWQALCRAMGRPELATDERFATLKARQENESELEGMIGEWTRGQVAEEAMRRLQGAGVPAGVVQNGKDVFLDPQLRHRGYWVELEHPEIGRHHYQASPFILSRTPAQLRPSPCLGQHNELVCRELLGISEEEYTQLLVEGALE